MKPIHKFNGGLGATLCNSCSVVISTGLTEDLYCEKCKQKNLLIEIMEADEKDGLYETDNMTHKELIEKYPKIFQMYEGNPSGVNWGIPEAWIPVIDDLCGAIQKYIDNSSVWDKEKLDWVHPPQATCIQMKEKFGGLRFYIDGGDDHIEGMISMAEYMCYNMCQHCGTRENLGVQGGWITICCKSCSKDSTNWEPLNK